MRKASRCLLFLVLLAATCGKSSSHGGGSPPGPPGPPGPVNITGPASPLAMAFVGVAITPITFTATGTAPINWTVTGGALTPGLALSLSGVLTGTPTTAGTFNFTVTATDPNGTDSAAYAQDVGTSLAESEPNDTAATADAFAIGAAATGTLATDDIDFWSFAGTAGQVIQVELFGLRSDFATWDANGNLPRLNLIGPNGTSYLDGPDYLNAGAVGWPWGAHDLDIPRFRIPSTGTYYVRLTPYLAATPAGGYVLRVTDVTPGSMQSETESNDGFSTANSITPGTIYGHRTDDNDDFFSFTITAPTLVYFEMTAYRNGVFGVAGAPDGDYYDPLIELRDTDGTTVMATNNTVFFNDSALHFHIVTSGTYYLRVGEASNGTTGDADYFLTFTATPVGSLTETETNDDAASATPIAYGDVVSGDINGGDVDFYSFSGNAGDIVRVFWFEFGASQAANDFVDIYLMQDDTTYVLRAISYTGVNSLACARAILPFTGTFYVRVTPAGGFTPYTFQLVLFKDATFETEGNDTTGTANAIPGSGRVAGIIGSASDVDFYSFTATAGEVVTFSIYAGVGALSNGFYTESGYGSSLFPDLEVRNGAGTVLRATPYMGSNFSGESVTNGLATSELTFVAATAGTYYVRVSPSDASGDSSHLYLLEKR